MNDCVGKEFRKVEIEKETAGEAVVGIRHAFAPVAGPVYVVDGGGSGDGLFDEVSTRRREDLQYLLGIGKYSREKW